MRLTLLGAIMVGPKRQKDANIAKYRGIRDAADGKRR